MQIYLAPLEGITTYVYRRAYEHHFGGVDRYFTPFIVNKKMAKKEIQGILPENNPGKELIPQIMSNNAEDFIQVSKEIASYGYDTVNLNLGCPSGTVVSKKRGAGFLAYPEELDAFLSEIYEKCPIKISIKTRIGLEDESEWDKILSIYEKYPLEELIIHPRLRSDFYKGAIRKETFARALEQIKVPICYNGELNSLEDVVRIKEEFPQVDRIMLGRGILRHPELVAQIRSFEAGQSLEDAKKRMLFGCTDGEMVTVAREASCDELGRRLRGFHDEVYAGYCEIMYGEKPTLFKMKELWSYMGESFPGTEKQIKQIKKANRLSEYESAINSIFM